MYYSKKKISSSDVCVFMCAHSFMPAQT
jgi:hypothetical protein